GGRFEDITASLAPLLEQPGLVTGAVWADVDRDGWVDLVVSVEWGDVKCFHNDQGHGFTDWTERLGFTAAGHGWWSALAAADCNGDGRPDFVVGNLGLNTIYHADATHPVLLYVGDFKGDGSEQLIEGYYEGDKVYPRRTRKVLGAEVPSILKRFPRNDAYARATLGEILGEDKLAKAQRFAATELRSGVFLSQSDGTYRFVPFPRLAQISPVQALVCADFDGDHQMDVFVVQNSYAPIPSVGRFDGGLSGLLHGDGHGGFTVVPPVESGLIVPGDAKDARAIDVDGDGLIDLVVTRNEGTLLVFKQRGRLVP
ncbi:MAG: VCBS repeat-containing protein, partial [Opitutus sp.]